jgi:hypothetical protein
MAQSIVRICFYAIDGSVISGIEFFAAWVEVNGTADDITLALKQALAEKSTQATLRRIQLG